MLTWVIQPRLCYLHVYIVTSVSAPAEFEPGSCCVMKTPYFLPWRQQRFPVTRREFVLVKSGDRHNSGPITEESYPILQHVIPFWWESVKQAWQTVYSGAYT